MAFDRDLGFNGDLLFVISDGDPESVFKIDTESGVLTIDSKLDRETKAEYMINITVFDQGVPQKSASRLLHIIVEDENDHAPVFFKSAFSFFFPENTLPNTSVVTLNATDADEGIFGEVSYRLETETQDFRMDEKTGLLMVNQMLDRETKEYYDLRIRAMDGDPITPKSSFATVRVRVLDVNDVRPTFSAENYVVKVREDLPVGSVAGMVDASDPDLYQGGKVRFSIISRENQDNQDFHIDEISGVVRVGRQLDYETRQFYNLTIKATDEGSPPLSSLANFLVEVVDVNENRRAPTFGNLFHRTAVPENRPIGSLVSAVTAIDPDEGEDGHISYTIRGGDGLGHFYIDDEGNIKTLAVLDRESKSFYWLEIYAVDGGAVPLSTKLYVYVEVLNQNDNVPLTEKPIYFAAVKENSKPFSHILTINSFDGDLSDTTKFTYEIVSGNPQSLFHIDPNSGIISTTKRLLDRETQDEHILEVLVSDNGQPPLNSTTRVVVSVEDENDHAPEFLERYIKVNVPETFVNERENRLQKDQGAISNQSVTDSTSPSEKDFQIWKEMFENSTWESFDFYEAGQGKPLFRSLADDKDIGENGRLYFSMKSSEKGKEQKLQIDRNSGIVYALDSVLTGEHFDILLKASDGGKRSALGKCHR